MWYKGLMRTRGYHPRLVDEPSFGADTLGHLAGGIGHYPSPLYR